MGKETIAGIVVGVFIVGFVIGVVVMIYVTRRCGKLQKFQWRNPPPANSRTGHTTLNRDSERPSGNLGEELTSQFIKS